MTTDGGTGGGTLPDGLRRLFQAHAVVALVFGVSFFVVPRLWAEWVAWGAIDQTMMRLYGAGLLALAEVSWLGASADDWPAVRLVVVLEVAFPALTAIAGLYEVLLAGAPAFTWVVVAVTGAFAVGFGYYYRELA